ncbi:glycosyltransferase family 1 protein [Acinetobacter apis]|uniref:Glycosyltransferase Family 4 n=1 Tax=Acinetobacter apis TaxID=1229165 RepID=A0A217EHH2_9GAMM|nr:glycosyltransferase family 1 protein [Acinetobacter apis]SNQ29955.1 Glycosyltransferase Family 4 [Acinetobacter apis]
MFVNCRNLVGHTTGVQRYTKKIIEGWDSSLIQQISPEEKFASGVKGHLWEQLVLPKYCKEKKLLWCPSNTGPLSYTNQVLTIHDTVPFDHPEWLNPKFVWWYKFLQPKLVHKVKHIITISEFSKRKIIEHFKVPDDKVSVVYNGVDISDMDFDINANNKFSNLPPYILSVGSLEPRKNLSRLISAFVDYKRETKSDIKLVIVGKKGVSRVFGESGINEIDTDDIIFTGHVSDQELQYLYKNTLAFCYPSLYEGFGLPPLEAMQFAVPVLTSNTTAIEELCKNRAILIEPTSINSISEGIFNILNGGISKETINDNVEYVKNFSWNKCAKQTFQILSDYK